MFERDKDDLRTLGIVIEVGSYDPLFNDEAGYRIKSEHYQLDLGPVTPTDISLLSLAADAWQGAAFADATQTALLKLNAMGVPADPINIPGFTPKLSNSTKELEIITDAIAQSDFLNFSYLSNSLMTEIRTIVPIALSNRSGYWYVSGVDQDIQEVRTFRLDRIQGDITSSKNKDPFEFPAEFELNEAEMGASSTFALIDVRKGKGHSLRNLAISVVDLGEWDQIRVPLFNSHSLAAEILWHGDDVFVQEPAEFRDLIVEQLEVLLSHHE
jgi:proteasome accessory factor B